VELDGEIVPHGEPVDKHVGRRRKILATIDATDLLREFARWCALHVIDLWDAPDVVRKYLETGDASLREAARDAAWAAARDSGAARAALAATREAAWEAARDAAWFAEMVEAAFAAGNRC
jgi:hypothetical protein